MYENGTFDYSLDYNFEDKEQASLHFKFFDKLKKHSYRDNKGTELWSARELQELLGYTWNEFIDVLDKTFKDFKQKNISIKKHIAEIFYDIRKKPLQGVDADDFKLDSFACLKVVENGDTTKDAVEASIIYFTAKLEDKDPAPKDFYSLPENVKRLYMRKRLVWYNKQFANFLGCIGATEPTDFIDFQNGGYKGLYNNMEINKIRDYKNIKIESCLFNTMGSMELLINLFRASITLMKIRELKSNSKFLSNKAQNKFLINDTHYHIARRVRGLNIYKGQACPEDMPVATNIKKIQREYHR
ncbi:MAG: hypothetical protein JJV93_01880 [Alphaproteobacteria bacterium]|nr:hypothetical protein [Alphaproteobacteria bacterium]